MGVVHTTFETLLEADPNIKVTVEQLPPKHQREYYEWLAAAQKLKQLQRRLFEASVVIQQR